MILRICSFRNPKLKICRRSDGFIEVVPRQSLFRNDAPGPLDAKLLILTATQDAVAISPHTQERKG